MAVKAKLKVRVLADDVVIAESEDPAFWQSVLSAIHSESASIPVAKPAPPTEATPTPPTPLRNRHDHGGVAGFAEALGLDPDAVQGACAPEESPPYMHLDHHYYEAFRRNTPRRGRSAIPNVTLAGTLLALWFKHAKLENGVEVGHIQQVLQNLSVDGPNAARSLKNCPWLQYRSSRVSLNPAKISDAVAVARAFCAQQPVSEAEP